MASRYNTLVKSQIVNRYNTLVIIRVGFSLLRVSFRLKRVGFSLLRDGFLLLLVGWLVSCFGLNGPLRLYVSRAVFQREGDLKEK